MSGDVAFAGFVGVVGLSVLAGKNLPDSIFGAAPQTFAAAALGIGRGLGFIGPDLRDSRWLPTIALFLGMTVIIIVAAEAGNVSNWPMMN